MDKIQGFQKGLNQDLSPVFQQEGSYVDAINIEAIDDELQGSVAISNSKGNKFQIDIPNIGAIYKISIKPGVSGDTLITINGITNPTPFDSVGKTTKDLYDYIIAYTPYGEGILFNIFYNSINIVLYPIPPNTITISLDITTFLTDPNPAFIPVNANLKVIGYGIIRDDIYLFTTNSDDQDPQTNGGGYGYIWKLTYDNITFDAIDATITLIYANDLDFSTFWNIPQTGVVGRYENISIQRLYWTDNYNPLRSINVVDPQLGALDLSIIDVEPSVDFDIPLLKDLRSAPGTALLPIGAYQLAYKLSNTGGASTSYSVPSNIVFVVQGYLATATPGASEEFQHNGENWVHYHGDIKGTTTTKRITWTINSLDRDFTRIEAVLIVRETKNGIPTIYSVFEGPVNSDSIDIVVDGDIINDTNTTIVTLDEFVALSSIFDRCKTIGTKDNSLVVGNVSTGISNGSSSTELDYDARAYRFKAANSFDLIENGVKNNKTSFFTPLIDPESDAINPFNLDPVLFPLADTISKYQADGIMLGGQGPNINYEFVSIAVACDKSVEPVSPQPLPIVSTNPDYTTDIIDINVYSADENGVDILQQYPLMQINEGMKFPQRNSVYWGYQHNEIYRIGIQFYDKSKNPYFVKWVGDIKFPDYFDVCPASNNFYENGQPTGLLDYRKSFINPLVTTHGANQSYACQLGLKLNIIIPANLTDDISGYSVVRVKRENADKTVIAEGIISNTFSEDGGSGGDYSLRAFYMDYDEAFSSKSRISFISPNILDANLTPPSAGMKLKVSSKLNKANSTVAVSIQGGVTSLMCYLLKMYNCFSITPFECNIRYAALMGLNSTITEGTDTYINMVGNVAPGGPCNGNPNYLLLLDTSIANSATGSEKFFAYIYNPIINQYSGNTFTDRANNEYILANHFRSTKTKSTQYHDISYIFGGDVTNDIMDEERISVDYIANPVGTSDTTFFYPASSPVNRRLRHGRNPNAGLNTETMANRTDYFYNTVYSAENNLNTYFTRPDPFIDNGIFDNRFYISEKKINGELVDSWGIFKPNNYWDVEGVYGPINSMLPLADKMYFWQDRAFGIIEINPRAMVTDVSSATNSQLQVGTGLPLQRHDYISIITGTKHQGSTISSSSKLYWYDTNLLKLMRFSRDESVVPVTDLKGLFAFFSKNLKTEIQNFDKPTYSFTGVDPIGINGVVATYDNKKHRAIYTFHSGNNTSVNTFDQTSFTVCLNELKDSFTTFYSFTPRIYINDNKYIISTDNTPSNKLHKLYLHDVGNYGEFYTVKYDTYVKFIVNPNPQVTKTFDNFVYDSQATIFDPTTKRYINFNDDTWDRIRVTDDYQNTDIQTLVPNTNIMRKERSWQLQIPRNRVLYTPNNSPNIYTNLSPINKSFAERIRDKYIQVELWYNNLTNRELKTNSFTTIFRKSDR